MEFILLQLKGRTTPNFSKEGEMQLGVDIMASGTNPTPTLPKCLAFGEGEQDTVTLQSS
jgi:hypothetical protein